MKHYIHINGILGVKTNINNFIWSYGKVSPEVSAEEYDKCLVKVVVEDKEDSLVFEPKDIEICDRKFQRFSSNTKDRILYYDRALPLNIRLRYAIQIAENLVTVTVGHSYLKWVKLRMMNIHSIQYVLSDIVCGLLLKNGYASLYCASCYFPELQRCVALFSAPGVGKTTTCMKLCETYGALFLSEDVAITDGEAIYSVPWTNSARCNKKRSIGILDSREKNADTVLQLQAKGLVYDKANLTDIIILERGCRGEDCDRISVFNRIYLLSRYLFHYRCSPAVTVLNYFFPAFSIEEMETKEKEILKKLILAAACRIISLPEGASFEDSVFRGLNCAEM